MNKGVIQAVTYFEMQDTIRVETANENFIRKIRLELFEIN